MNALGDLFRGISAAFGDSRVRGLLALTLTLIAVASAFYMWAEGWGLIDSAYFSVITIATVGYGDFAPRTALGKLFTIFYVLIGLGIFVATATSVADVILTARRQRDDGDKK
jgi:voltage-gated potassium channel